MYNLASRFRSFITRRPLRYYLQVAQGTLRPLAVPALAVGTLILGAVSGLVAINLSPKMTRLALAGLVAFLVAFSGPELMILIMLAASSTVINPLSLPSIGRFTAVELCLIFLLGLVVAKVLSNREKNVFVRTPLDWPVFLFFVASTLSFFNARYNLGTTSDRSIPIWRTLFDYMVFFAITNLVRTRRQLMTLVNTMVVMATTVAVLMIAQQAVGTSVRIIPGIVVGSARTMWRDFVGVARIMTPGASIVYVMLLPAFILHITPGYLAARKWLSFIPIVLLPLAVAFTFDRNMWIGLTLSGIMFIIITRSESKNFILLISTLVIVASLLIPLLNAYFPRMDGVIEALSFRAGSLFAGGELVHDGSTQLRLGENEHAMAKIKEHPLLGIGPGGEYRKPWWNRDTLTNYVHNAYLYLLVDVGIVGFLPFLWFSVAYLVRGLHSWYTLKDRILRSLIMGFTLSYVAILISSVAAPRLLTINWVTLVGVMLGINEVAIRLEQQSVPSTTSN